MPFYKFDITVPLSPEVVTNRLQDDLVEPHSFFSWVPLSLDTFLTGTEVKELFIGKIKENRFSIKYVHLGRRNSFHPVIRGRITASGKGTHIDVLAYINPPAAAFFAFWFFSGITFVFTGGLHPLKMFIGGLAFFIAGLLIVMSRFWDETMKAKKMLILLWTQEDTKIVMDTGSTSDKIKCVKCGHFNTRICSKCLYCGADIVSV